MENQSPLSENDLQGVNDIMPTELEVEVQSVTPEVDTVDAEKILEQSLLNGVLGFVNFDISSVDNNSTGALIPKEKRGQFKRDVYVCIEDSEQGLEFLGRIVEGPFHSPHELSADSAITRTTVLHPDRTKFRPSYYVYGTVEVLGELTKDESVLPTPTRPRPYSTISIYPAHRLKKLLGINGDMLLGSLMGYENEKVVVEADSNSKNFLPRNVGIFGTVGSGKSNTTQVLIEEATKAGWAVVVIDVEGEYVKMNLPNDMESLNIKLATQFQLTPKGVDDFKVYVPTSGETAAEESKRFKVPIYGIDKNVIYDIQEFTEAQQRMFERVIYEFYKRKRGNSSSRLGALSTSNEKPFVSELKELKNKYPNEEDLKDDLENLLIKYSIDNRKFYTLQDLINTLDDAFINTLREYEKPTAYTLRSKLQAIGTSGMLDTDKNGNIEYLQSLDLLQGGRLSVLDVSETDDRSRNIAIAYVLQSLFEKVIETSLNEKMKNGAPRPKVLVVIEEVHTFVSRQSVGKMKAVLDNLQTISRRGRKRWMSLALVSQELEVMFTF